MVDFFNVEALAVIAYVLTLIICLGLIFYVVWGWKKRVQVSSRKLKRFAE